MSPVFLLLLAFSVALAEEAPPSYEWPLPSSPPLPFPTASPTQAPEPSTPSAIRSGKRVQRIQNLVEEAFKKTSYAQLKSYVPKEIVDFLENIEFRDFPHLQSAVMYASQVFENQAKRNPNTPVEELSTAAVSIFYQVLNYRAPKLEQQERELEEVLKEKYIKLEESTRNSLENIFKTVLILASKGDSQRSEEEKAILTKAASNEEIEHLLVSTPVRTDVLSQFPELQAFLDSDLGSSIVSLYLYLIFP